MINQEVIGKRVAALRKQKGYSQEDLAKMLKMPRPSLAQIEMGKRNITAGELLLLSEKLEVSIDGLLARNFMSVEEPAPDYKVTRQEKPKERISVPTLQVDKFKIAEDGTITIGGIAGDFHKTPVDVTFSATFQNATLSGHFWWA